MGRLIRPVVLTLLLALPAMAWAWIKPVRVVAPELLGLSCTPARVCVDDPARAAEAAALYRHAIDFVQSEVGEIRQLPRAIFCSSKACSSKFGLHRGAYGHAAAYNVGTFGLVISYRGWHPWFVRHELIHHVQTERLGSLNAWFFKPLWFKEGMAYALSQDPRLPLPGPLEVYRTKYQAWAGDSKMEDLWRAAEAL